MKIERYDSGLLSSNMFLLSENGHALVIDPALDTAPGEAYALDLMIITHEHYDHISGVNAWKERYKVPLLCSEAAAGRITDSKKNQARHFDVFCQLQSYSTEWDEALINKTYTCQADLTFRDELKFNWQGHELRLLEIPGHSRGSIGIYIDNIWFVSGDSLLEKAVVELRLPGGNKADWKELGEKRIAEVPKGTIILPGHYKCFVLE